MDKSAAVRKSRVAKRHGPAPQKHDADGAQVRRSTNACHRCKSKKIRCFFTGTATQSTCTPCSKSRADCKFDVSPDGIPKGADYIAALEAQVGLLQKDLALANARLQRQAPTPDGSEPHILRSSNTTPPQNASVNVPSVGDRASPQPGIATAQKRALDSRSEITIFNLLQTSPWTSIGLNDAALLELPSAKDAEHLFEMTYMYTQARYCIFEWSQLRQWHSQRELYCQSYRDANVEIQTAAFFIWMVYAIGAQLDPSLEKMSRIYYAHAHSCLQTVLAQQNLVTVQALLALSQYHFRAVTGPSVWHLVGTTLKLCIELGYHRKWSEIANNSSIDLYTIELQKRFFWCAYCFDRMLGMVFKRPFGIHDTDIDAELPVDIDVECTDAAQIRLAQAQPSTGTVNENTVTSMSSCLHHLQLYRLRSKIITKFTGPGALAPTVRALEFFEELAEWNQQAPVYGPLTNLPRRSAERVEATYFEAVLLLIRPILAQATVDPDLLHKCAELSADACKNTRALSLSPNTQQSRITVYNCFRCGITLLQCLVVQPATLSLRETHKALSYCSSALVVFTQQDSTAAPYLQLFDKLSDHFLSDGDNNNGVTGNQVEKNGVPLSLYTLRSILQRIASSGPSETLELYRSLCDDQGSSESQDQIEQADLNLAYSAQDSAFMWCDSMSAIGLDLVMPYEMFSDIPMLQDASLQGVANMWPDL